MLWVNKAVERPSDSDRICVNRFRQPSEHAALYIGYFQGAKANFGLIPATSISPRTRDLNPMPPKFTNIWKNATELSSALWPSNGQRRQENRSCFCTAPRKETKNFPKRREKSGFAGVVATASAKQTDPLLATITIPRLQIRKLWWARCLS